MAHESFAIKGDKSNFSYLFQPNIDKLTKKGYQLQSVDGWHLTSRIFMLDPNGYPCDLFSDGTIQTRLPFYGKEK